MIAFCEEQVQATQEKGARGEYATYVDLKKNFLEDTNEANWSFQYKFILRSYYLAYCSGEIMLRPEYPPLLTQVRQERREATLRACEFANIRFDSTGRLMPCNH
jgi:hypothetical protein